MRFYVATNAIKIEKLLGLNPLNRLYEDIKNLIKQSHLGPEDKKILDDRNLAFICAVNSPKLNEEDSTNLIEEISHIIQPSKLEKICYLITSSILWSREYIAIHARVAPRRIQNFFQNLRTPK
jgi:hypothetical protein